jgi:outer membrane protein
MKRVLKVLTAQAIMALAIIGIFHTGAQAQAAQQPNVGIVDTQKVINESEPGKRAKANYETFIKSKQAAIEEKGKKIEALKEEFQKQNTAMSEDAKKKKEEDIQKLIREYQRNFDDSKEEVRKKEIELFKGIVKDIHDIVEALGKEERYSIILERGTVAYFDGSVDLTAKVINRYNDANKKK